MADTPVVHIGENSPENIAYKLTLDVARVEGKYASGRFNADRKYILDTYAEALFAVRGHRSF